MGTCFILWCWFELWIQCFPYSGMLHWFFFFFFNLLSFRISVYVRRKKFWDYIVIRKVILLFRLAYISFSPFYVWWRKLVSYKHEVAQKLRFWLWPWMLYQLPLRSFHEVIYLMKDTIARFMNDRIVESGIKSLFFWKYW